MSIDHDQIFKRLIEAFFREFMELFCPVIAGLIDFSRVEFLHQEHFTDIRRGIRRRVDLVAKEPRHESLNPRPFQLSAPGFVIVASGLVASVGRR